MFSREWFVYVFGRWLLLSGLAGAAIQVLFADRLGIPTFPAFLLNQFCLACVFWYVDEYIFRRYFGKVKAIFRFPRIKGEFSMEQQLEKISEEYTEFAASFKRAPDDSREWLNHLVDLSHVVEMTERIVREQGVDMDKEYYDVINENRQRGLYEGDKKKGNR